MGIGYRCFVVEGDEVRNLSQKVFNAFYFRKQAQLPQYAKRTIVVATVIYQTEQRVPLKIIRTDATRLKVSSDGSLDEGALRERMGNLFRFAEPSSGVVALPSPKISPAAALRMRNAIFPRDA